MFAMRIGKIGKILVNNPQSAIHTKPSLVPPGPRMSGPTPVSLAPPTRPPPPPVALGPHRKDGLIRMLLQSAQPTMQPPMTTTPQLPTTPVLPPPGT